MNKRRSHIQALLAVMADPSRFQILCELAAGARHVSDLAETVGLSQSCTTRHVQALARAGSVACRREGKRVMVSVRADDDVTRSLLRWISSADAEPGTDIALGAHPGAGVVASRPIESAPARQRKERTPADPVDSGTPDTHSDGAPSLPPPRSAALEDFLL